MARPETACPFCAFSPVAPGAEACPKCRRKFVAEVREDSEVTATRAGGLTGAVTASPLPTAIALLVAAAVWALRILDLFSPAGDPGFLLALPALLVLGAVSVLAAAGPAKHLPAALGLVSGLVAVGWSTSWPVVNAALVAFGPMIFLGTVSEPSTLRLRVGAGLATTCAVVALAALAIASPGLSSAPMPVVVDEQSGVRWRLPSGWKQVDAAPGLPVVKPGPGQATVFVSNGDGAEGALLIGPQVSPDGCSSFLDALAPAAERRRVGENAPAPFLKATPVLELTSSSAVTRAACSWQPKGPLLGLVVAQATASDSVALATFRVLAAGVELGLDPTRP